MKNQRFPNLASGCHLAVLCAVLAAVMTPRAPGSPTMTLVEKLTVTTQPDRYGRTQAPGTPMGLALDG